MPITQEPMFEMCDEAAEQFRLIAKEHPASGQMRVLCRNLAVRIFWGRAERVARTHMLLASKQRRRGNIQFAIYHCGAASALKDSKKFGRTYAAYTSALLKAGE